MRLPDEDINKACKHLKSDRDQSLDRAWLYSQLALARRGMAHDEEAVTVIRQLIRDFTLINSDKAQKKPPPQTCA